MGGRNENSAYVFGFNGFQQIDRSTPDNTVSLPQKCNTDRVDTKCVFAWSQLWMLTDPVKTEISGFMCEEVADLLRKQSVIPRIVIPHGHYTILQNANKDSQNLLLLKDTGTLMSVMCEDENIEIAGATENEVFVTKDGDFYKGSVYPCEERLCLKVHALELTIKVSMVACGFDHTLILSRDGEVYTCGSSSRGQLGLGDTSVDVVHTSVAVPALEGIRLTKVAAGGWHSTAVTDCGDLYVWGWNESGQLGLPNRNITAGTEGHQPVADNSSIAPGVPLSLVQSRDPVQVQTVPFGLDIPDEMRVTQVACGSRHTCVLLDSGYLLTTGWNKYGQLGHGDLASCDHLRTVMYFVHRREAVTEVFAGFWNTGVITKLTEALPPDAKPS